MMRDAELLNFTLVGINEGEASPAMEMVLAADLDGAWAHAKTFLLDHQSCTRVEVWRDAGLVLTVVRP
jgi:hypothetical protein